LHAGRPLIPRDGEVRWHALRMQAVAQGMAEAGVGYRRETERRPAALRYAALRDGLADKLSASYDWLEQNLDDTAALHVGHVALATALSWLEFRELPGFRVSRTGVHGFGSSPGSTHSQRVRRCKRRSCGDKPTTDHAGTRCHCNGCTEAQ